jgi:hypothetical protein
VLTDILSRPPDALGQTALAQQERADAAARSIPASVEPLLATLGDLVEARTARWLDQLAAANIITDAERAAFAADPATRSLTQLLRRAELAGHNAEQLLSSALEIDALDGAHSVAQVTHRRIRDRLDEAATPLEVTSFSELIPADVPEAYRPALQRWADKADTRRHELGARAGAASASGQPPGWVASLGPVPADPFARADWETKAGWAATWREQTASVAPLADHDPLGASPPAGLVEKRAIWETAHRALALADAGAAEETASEGLLRARVRAWQREQAWAPPHVADQLAATYEALHRAETDATIWAARAAAATDLHDRRQLTAAAAQARAEADRCRGLIPDLETADDARARWYAHTAPTRDAAERADAALRLRGIDPDTANEQVTAAEWLAAHRVDQTEEEQTRDITEADLDQHYEQVSRGAVGADEPELDTNVADIREITQANPHETTPEKQPRRIPLAAETASAIERATNAVHEIDDRELSEAAQPHTDEVGQHGSYSEPEWADRLNRYAAEDDNDSETAGYHPSSGVSEHDIEYEVAEGR